MSTGRNNYQNYVVANAAETISSILYDGDKVYNDDTAIEYRIKVVNTIGAETLESLIDAGTAVIEDSSTAASIAADAVVTDAFIAADIVVTDAFIAADVVAVTAAADAADIADASYPLTAAFGAAFPVTDPLVIGQVWSNAGILTVSAG